MADRKLLSRSRLHAAAGRGDRLPGVAESAGVEEGPDPPHLLQVLLAAEVAHERDRKSTRLNSSHDQISYAVFCLPKKTRWFRALTQHRSKFNSATGPIPPLAFEEAESLFKHLIHPQDRSLLLHSDIHHFSIVAA